MFNNKLNTSYDYLTIMITLEDQVKLGFDELKIDDTIQRKAWTYLDNIKVHHEPTYTHSLRTAILARKIAEFTHINSKEIFIAGLLHDIGKMSIDSFILDKKGKLEEKDMNIIREHVNLGYDLIKDDFSIPAQIMRRHHMYQQNAYPIIFDNDFGNVDKNMHASILQESRLLALSDFYDALTTRNNDAFCSNDSIKSNDEYLQIMFKYNSDQETLIKNLSLAGILNGFYKEIKNDVSIVEKNNLYNNISWQNKYSSSEVARRVMLACALEPISNKYGCTTRYIDAHPCIKFDYFISAAINIGDSFRELSDRIQDYNNLIIADSKLIKKPLIIYDLAYKAQQDSKKNHAGGRINQGIIELLIPIVAAQMKHSYDGDNYCGVNLMYAKKILNETTKEDVDFLIQTKRLAFDLSGYGTREVKSHLFASNVFQYYYYDMLASPIGSTSYLHNSEFVNGFPTVKKIYDLISNDNSSTLARKVENAYSEIRLVEHKNIGAGLTADYVAAALYLLLSSNQKEVLVK